MDNIFINSENSKTSKPHILKLKLKSKLDLRLGEKVIALSNLSIYYTWRNIKSSYNNKKFKISVPTWIMNLNYQMVRILYQIFKIISNTFCKKHGENTNKPSVQIYLNKIKNRITFRIKDGYRLELLTPETMKLLGSTENDITKEKNGENVPHIEITEVVLVHYNMVNNDYQQGSRVLYTFFPSKPFGALLDISPKKHIFLKTLNSEYNEIEVCFTDKNSKTLQIADRINLTMVIK